VALFLLIIECYFISDKEQQFCHFWRRAGERHWNRPLSEV